MAMHERTTDLAQWQRRLGDYGEALRDALDAEREEGAPFAHRVAVGLDPTGGHAAVRVTLDGLTPGQRFAVLLEPMGARPATARGGWGFAGAEGREAWLWKQAKARRWTRARAADDARDLVAVANTAALDAGEVTLATLPDAE